MKEVPEIQEIENTTGKLERNSKLYKSNLKLIFKPFSEYIQLSPFKGRKCKSGSNLLTLGTLYREELNFRKPEMVEVPDFVKESDSVTPTNSTHTSSSDISYTDEESVSCKSATTKLYDGNLLKIKATNEKFNNNKEPFNAKLSIFKARSNNNTISDKSDAEWYNFLSKLDEVLDNRVGEFV